MRSLPALLLLSLAACHTLSSDELQQLASYQRNAGLYLDGGKYDQALGLVERGLEVDPNDYKLRSMRGNIHLRLSAPAASEDQRMLDLALTEFAELYGERAPARHDRHVLFFYALARHKQGLRKFAEAARLDPRQEGATEAATELRAEGNAELDGARSMLALLLDRGEIPRLCHYHLLQIAALVNDSAAILEQGRLYLAAAAEDQAKTQAEIDRTTVYGYEVERKTLLQSLREEEIAVRTLMAQQLYAQRDFAGALPHIDAVLKIDPARSDDHYNRGLILQKLGRDAEAKDDLRTFLATTSLPPDSPKVADAVKALTR